MEFITQYVLTPSSIIAFALGAVFAKLLWRGDRKQQR